MNWTASLLRNELKKQKETYESRLNLLTNASLDAQNYLDLEEKLKVLEANLKATEQNLTKAKSEVELKEKVKETEVKDKDQAITHLEKKVVASKELIFNLRKEIRTNQLYHQRNLRTEREKYETKLKTQTKQLRAEITLLNSSETDQQRELQERGKLIIKLEEQVKETKKELEFANSKVKQLSPLFNQVLAVIKKNVILRGKKDLKEAIANIQELMEWEKSPLVTEINTPTEPIKTAEQLALEEELVAVKKTIMEKKDLETKIESLQKQKKKTEELKEAESNLKATEQNQAKLKSEAELKEKDKEITTKKEQNKILQEQIKELEGIITNLKEKLPKSLAQQWLDKIYPKDKRKEIERLDLCSKNLEGELDLSDFVNLRELDCFFNDKLTSLDLSKNNILERFICFANPLKELIYPKSWIENKKLLQVWKRIRNNTKPIISQFLQLVDTSDLDNWVANYDYSKVGDYDYHAICGGINEKLFCTLEEKALDNLGNQVIARKYIILARLLTAKEDLPKLAVYEENMNELAEGFQKCPVMVLPSKKDGKEWTIEEQEIAVNKALSGDKELLSRLQDLPYLHPDYKFKETATEPSASDKKKLKKWRNISLNFTEELINQWESKGFSFEQTFDWVSNIGLKPSEAEYTYWLQNIIEIDSTKYLNETSSEDQANLKKQFEEYKQSK